MSLITHPCIDCGHPDYWRTAMRQPRKTCGTFLGCSCTCTPGEPELRPTYDLAFQPVERIVKPGDNLTDGVRTCGCGLCMALYEQLTGSAA